MDEAERAAARKAASKEYRRRFKVGQSQTEPNRRWYPPTESDLPLHSWRPYTDFHNERIRANEKHVDKPGGSMECKAYDNPDWLPVIVEEVGEVAKVICDYRHGLFDYDEFKRQMRAELVQVGAMVSAWVDAIDLDYRGPDGKDVESRND